jgi:EAL and modified HD-GYP domain-containing signal transduction protein
VSAEQPAREGELRYFSRQPILNATGHVHGYELLFRNGPKPGYRRDCGEAVETMLDSAVMFGLEGLTNGLPAFVACTEEALVKELVLVLTPSLTVLCLPASCAPSDKLVEALRSLKTRGYRLALDDFCWRDKLQPLVEQADYVRLDFRRFDAEEQRRLLRIRGGSTIAVAQKTETPEDYQAAEAKGFTLFQGNYFCRPVLLRKRKAPANCGLHFELVREIYRHPIDVGKIGQLVRRDASLTYRLLRLVNSPVYAIQQEIRRIESAILALGEETFRRVVSLAVMSELNMNQPVEILHLALIRARFCELSASRCDQAPAEQYLLGMLSLLPAMLGLPMEEITPTLPLRAEICEALAGTSNPERYLLDWLEFHERGEWTACDGIAAAHGLDRKELARRYEEAVVWAGTSLHSAAA